MILNFENVSLVKNNKKLLDQIDWQIAPHEHWGILGLNGAGKSMLLQMVTGQVWPSSGNLTVLGEKFGQTSIPSLQKRIGWVSNALQQKLHQFDTVESIVLSGKFASIGVYEKTTREDLEKAAEILEVLGIAEIQKRPYEMLSQGQRQLVLVARAMMSDPEVLILDEPCNSLDLFAREELLQIFENLANQENGPTLIYVTHHVEELLPVFSHVMLLKAGKVIRQGSRKEILNRQTLETFYGKGVHFIPYLQERLAIIPELKAE